MAKIPLTEFQERLSAAKDMLLEAYPDNVAVVQMIEAIEIASLVVFHMSVPFQNVVEEKIDMTQ